MQDTDILGKLGSKVVLKLYRYLSISVGTFSIFNFWVIKNRGEFRKANPVRNPPPPNKKFFHFQGYPLWFFNALKMCPQMIDKYRYIFVLTFNKYRSRLIVKLMLV